MNRYLVHLYKGDYVREIVDFPTLTQARKACKQYIKGEYTTAAIIDRERRDSKYISIFGDASVTKEK